MSTNQKLLLGSEMLSDLKISSMTDTISGHRFCFRIFPKISPNKIIISEDDKCDYAW